MAGLIYILCGAVLTFLAYLIGKTSAENLAELKHEQIIEEARRQAAARNERIVGNLSEVATKLVSETPSAKLTSSKTKDVRELAAELLQRAKESTR